MVERGVRFVQLYCGDTNGWDAHSDLEGNHGKLCLAERPADRRPADGPEARAACWTSTLVIWGGEFGRTPMTRGDQRPRPQPARLLRCGWPAAACKGGQAIGATDAVGLRAAEDKAHVHDLHATILHLLGFNHRKLTFRHNGRDERLTDNAGEVIEQALA